MIRIPLKKLYPDPQNPNVCPEAVCEKISRNIERTGYYPPLIVRPHPTKAGAYMIIDGHFRKQILAGQGQKEADCIVWEVSEVESRLLLATLNRLRGEDNPRKRAQLLESLIQTFPIDDLSQLIPETASEIKDLIALLDLDFQELEKTLQKTMADEAAGLPVPLTFMIRSDDIPCVEKALSLFSGSPKSDRGEALVSLCRKVLESNPLEGDDDEA